jgi:hypothetical protein
MAFMINKLTIINSCEIVLEIFFAKNHCEIQVRTILVCALYLIKYRTLKKRDGLTPRHDIASVVPSVAITPNMVIVDL